LLKDLNRALHVAGGPCLEELWPGALLSIQQEKGLDLNMPVKDEDVARAINCFLGSLLYLFHERATARPKAREAMRVVTAVMKAGRGSSTTHSEQQHYRSTSETPGEDAAVAEVAMAPERENAIRGVSRMTKPAPSSPD